MEVSDCQILVGKLSQEVQFDTGAAVGSTIAIQK
jgi:hypothetical protein